MTSKSSAYIAGLWQSTETEFAVFNPADGTLIANVSDCGVQEANQAIEAACEAFPKWEKLSVKVYVPNSKVNYFSKITSHFMLGSSCLPSSNQGTLDRTPHANSFHFDQGECTF